MDFKNYNSQREKLLLPEYGRHIQSMVKQLMEIKDKDLRTSQAHAVINVMGNLNNNLRDTQDFKHKLWDHLFIMSNFKLDVDSPYPIPSIESLTPTPERIAYPKGKIKHKQYGKNIRGVIDLIKKSTNQEDKLNLAQNIAKFMKVKSYEYNQEYPSDEVIINDLKEFSGNSIILDDDSLNSTKLIYRNNKTQITKHNNYTNNSKNRPSITKNKPNFVKKSPTSNTQPTVRTNKNYKRTK